MAASIRYIKLADRARRRARIASQRTAFTRYAVVVDLGTTINFDVVW